MTRTFRCTTSRHYQHPPIPTHPYTTTRTHPRTTTTHSQPIPPSVQTTCMGPPPRLTNAHIFAGADVLTCQDPVYHCICRDCCKISHNELADLRYWWSEMSQMDGPARYTRARVECPGESLSPYDFGPHWSSLC
jgi:hypothetical protein